MKKIAVLGGGPAGAAAAYAAAKNGATVILFEKNEKLGKKLYITGKGRCNLTNDCADDVFLKNIVNGEKFMFSALHAFSVEDTKSFFVQYGVPLKIERGNRVFPLSDKSSDIIKALSNALVAVGVEIRLNTAVEPRNIKKRADGFEIAGEHFDSLIVACGGLSYPSTGSTGDGFLLGSLFGHSIVAPQPALAPILLKQDVSSLEGLSLKNVALTAICGTKSYRFEGEMLFTDRGISGPLVLTMSSYINRLDFESIELRLDLKPALSEKMLDDRIVRDFQKFKGKHFKNSLDDLLPKSMISYIIEKSGILPHKQVDHITAKERMGICDCLKKLPFSIEGIAPIEAAVVTSGGICLKEISPKTMQSKLVNGLYFAGENLDIDALTGGFNIQCALSTGYLAGLSAATND